MSLERAISKLGLASRTTARDWIRGGQVSVNGTVERVPATRVDMDRDRIEVRGASVKARERVYLVLNKPRGLVTTAEDERGRSTVYECLQDSALPWLGPVGRLDQDSEGLLLFTNDTRWADRVLDPSAHVEKVYHVRTDAPLEPAAVARLTAGVAAGRGERFTALRARPLGREGDPNWIEVVLSEGKNRQVRRMVEAIGGTVDRLVRIAIGPLRLQGLAPGAWRHLAPEEVRALDPRPPQPRGRRNPRE